jgi:geranylgeranyl diphosphate synthase type I
MEFLSLEEFCKRFEVSLQEYLDSEFFDLRDTWFSELGVPERDYMTDKLVEYTKEAVRGGKRFRPYLIYIQACPLSYEESINFGIAVELLHSFALVHDDFMDKADTRRSKKTINQFCFDLLENYKVGIDKLHFANSMAVLIGDYLFSLAEGAFEKSAESPACKYISGTQVKAARNLFQKLKSEVILGQMLDMELALYENPSKNEILQKTFLKTANYSVTRPMQIGTVIRGGNAEEVEFCQEFGFNLGLGFQIQDDYLNLAYSKEVTGKNQFADFEEGKDTLASWYLLNEAEEKYKLEFAKYFGVPLKPEQHKEVYEFCQNSGCLEFLENSYTKYYSECYNSTSNPALVGLIKYLESRTK